MNFELLTLHAAHSGGFDLIGILLDSLIDIAKMLPLLFLAYLVIETVEHKAMDKLKKAFSNKSAGVFSGAILGLFPQCGFSVAAANLYCEKFISAGVLIAVFVSTSDEALPIILSKPETAKYFLPLLLIKLIAAIIAGFLLDLVLKLLTRKHASEPHSEYEHKHHDHHDHPHDHKSEHIHEGGEHHHCAVCDSNAGIFKNSLLRTLSTALFVFVTVLVFNIVVSLVGEENIENIMKSAAFLQPFIAALIGLIPSCAPSVILAGLFTEGVISFGALAAGLCAGAGAGMAVLFKSNKSIKSSLSLLAYLWVFSSVVGVIISIF